MKTEIIINGVKYNLDIQKAKELGVLEEENTKCKSYENFTVKYYKKQGFHYDDINMKLELISTPIKATEQLTENEAIAIQAFSKLLKLRRNWIGDWEPNWHNTETKYCISVCNTHISVNSFCSIQRTFSFPTKEMTTEFLECFRNLFEQCKCLI